MADINVYIESGVTLSKPIVLDQSSNQFAILRAKLLAAEYIIVTWQQKYESAYLYPTPTPSPPPATKRSCCKDLAFCLTTNRLPDFNRPWHPVRTWIGGKPPREQMFYRVLASSMTLVSLGNRTMWGYKAPNKFYVYNSFIVGTFAPACLITQFVYLFAYYKELTFDTLGVIFSIVPVSCLANVNVYSARLSSFKHVMNEFMTKIHLHNKYESNNKFLEEKLMKVERFTRWTAYYLIFFFTMNWVAWIWIPLINNIHNKEFINNRTMKLQTCIYMWMPFDYNYNYRNWVVTHLVNIYVVGCGVIVMMIFHTLNYIFIYHLIGHIQILKHTIRTGFIGVLSDGDVKHKLSEIVRHHSFITKVFKDVQSAFGINVATNYLHNLVGDSLIMYQIMYGGKENVILYIVMVVVYMGGLVLMSFVLEEIRRESSDLSDVIYCIPWENMSVSNQKTMILILQKMQFVMYFKALGGFRAGVGPMISIIRTTFSYYVMLESTMSGEPVV